MKYEIEIDREQTKLDLAAESQEVEHDGKNHSFEFWQQENGRFLLRIGQKLYTLDNVDIDGSSLTFTLNGEWITATVKNEQDLLLDRLGFEKPGEMAEGSLKAPMPGKILDIMVEEGDSVELDQPVIILEAMKMENELTSPGDGTVRSVKVQKGDSVDKNAILLEIEASG